MKNRKGKPSKVKRSVVTPTRTELPKDVKSVNPTLKIVKHQQPKKPRGKKKVPKYRQPQ